MSEFSSEKSINESLDVIRNALQDKGLNENTSEDALLLKNLVKNDGTIVSVSNNKLKKQDIDKILQDKLSQLFDQHLDNWLNKNIPEYLEKYFSKKEK